MKRYVLTIDDEAGRIDVQAPEEMIGKSVVVYVAETDPPKEGALAMGQIGANGMLHDAMPPSDHKKCAV